MILLVAVLLGLAAGLARAAAGRRPYTISAVRGVWLACVAFLPQAVAFFLPWTRSAISDRLAAWALVSSQLLLAGFVWMNRRQVSFQVMGLGLLCNLAVILLNGGLMPIRPDVVARLAPELDPDHFVVGSRFGTTKDVILPAAAIRLEWLADRFVFPAWFPYRVAFSVGDVLIAAGAFWFLWEGGSGKLAVQRDRT